MTRVTSLCFFLFTILTSVSYPLAQNSPKTESLDEDPCARYKMRVVKPPDDVDYKLRITKISDDIDPRMVINPCKMPPYLSRLGTIQNNIGALTGTQLTPTLRFRFPSGGEMKSPSEMLKELALPKSQKSWRR